MIENETMKFPVECSQKFLERFDDPEADATGFIKQVLPSFQEFAQQHPNEIEGRLTYTVPHKSGNTDLDVIVQFNYDEEVVLVAMGSETFEIPPHLQN